MYMYHTCIYTFCTCIILIIIFFALTAAVDWSECSYCHELCYVDHCVCVEKITKTRYMYMYIYTLYMYMCASCLKFCIRIRTETYKNFQIQMEFLQYLHKSIKMLSFKRNIRLFSTTCNFRTCIVQVMGSIAIFELGLPWLLRYDLAG